MRRRMGGSWEHEQTPWLFCHVSLVWYLLVCPFPIPMWVSTWLFVGTGLLFAAACDATSMFTVYLTSPLFKTFWAPGGKCVIKFDVIKLQWFLWLGLVKFETLYKMWSYFWMYKIWCYFWITTSDTILTLGALAQNSCVCACVCVCVCVCTHWSGTLQGHFVLSK